MNTVVKKPRHTRAIIERVLFYILWGVSAVLLMRIVFFLLGANPAAPFIQWLYTFSEVFVAPFSGIFPTPQYNTSVLDLASVTAICIYFIATLAIVKLLNVTNITR